jgi:hypothetical protein
MFFNLEHLIDSPHDEIETNINVHDMCLENNLHQLYE